jgi:hypothetical protein
MMQPAGAILGPVEYTQVQPEMGVYSCAISK